MSASNENLLEKINIMRRHIEDIEERGEDPHSVKVELEKMIQRFNTNSKMLNESKTILKG